MDPFGATAAVTTVTSTDRLDSDGSFSSQCFAFRCTHTSANSIRLLCIRLALPLTLSLPSRFAASARLVVGVSSRVLWLAGPLSCDCMFWHDREGRLTRQPVGPLVRTATITSMTSRNRVDSGGYSSQCCAFRRTYTRENPIRLLGSRLALPDRRMGLYSSAWQ